MSIDEPATSADAALGDDPAAPFDLELVERELDEIEATLERGADASHPGDRPGSA